MINLEISGKSVPLPGYAVCGDGYTIEDFKELTTIGCIDGLGHGEKAHEAVIRAIECIRENKMYHPDEIILECHKALRGTVGAAISILQIDRAEHTIEYAGVGNIDLRAYSRVEIHPISYAGIVGYNLRKVQAFKYKTDVGDIFIITTDGISSKYDIEEYKEKSSEELVNIIFEKWYKNLDDGTAIVIKVLSPVCREKL